MKSKSRWSANWPSVRPSVLSSVLSFARACALPLWLLVALCAVPPGAAAAGPGATAPEAGATALTKARAGFVSRIVLPEDREPAPAPPPGHAVAFSYPSPAGTLRAFHSPVPPDGQRHAAVIWLHGGDLNALDDEAFEPGEARNDQSVMAFAQAGHVLVKPTLRGGNDNPGRREAWYGEVDDVLALVRRVRQMPFVDPQRIYLGGHSTGATLALLVAETGVQLRAVFAFGPRAQIARHGTYGVNEWMPSQPAMEQRLRSPLYWLDGIRSPTLVMEGALAKPTLADLKEMRAASRNPQLRFLAVPDHDHFTYLRVASLLMARFIKLDHSQPKVDNWHLDEDELLGYVLMEQAGLPR